jgi:hypothetical protein
MKPPDRSAVLMIEDITSSKAGYNSHHLLQVTKGLPFKQWIFDITGPQLNVFDPCLDLLTYSKKYVDRFQLTAPFGTARVLMDNWVDENLADTNGMVGLLDRVDQNAVRALEKGIQEWQARSRSSIPDLLRLPESTFKRQEEELLAAMQRSLDEFLSSSKHMSWLSIGEQDTVSDLS